MTEKKRFTMDNESDIIEFDYNNNEYIQDFMWADGKSWDKICNRLNELYDENKQLKMENNSLKLLVQNWEALDEEKDGQLDKQNQALKKLKNENEQLKQRIKSRLHFYRELYETTNDDTVKRVIEDLEDILKE